MPIALQDLSALDAERFENVQTPGSGLTARLGAIAYLVRQMAMST